MRVIIDPPRLHAAAVAAVCATLLGCGAGTPGPKSIDPTAEPERVTTASGTSTLTSREISRAAHASRVEELFYRLPGVSVTPLSSGTYSVRIRGAGSPRAGGEPLYVVDGVAAHGDPQLSPLTGIQPADVTHIEVLRPTAATTMYGRRGQNGAIVITTKLAGSRR